jgi:hypothetical protein
MPHGGLVSGAVSARAVHSAMSAASLARRCVARF